MAVFCGLQSRYDVRRPASRAGGDDNNMRAYFCAEFTMHPNSERLVMVAIWTVMALSSLFIGG